MYFLKNPKKLQISYVPSTRMQSSSTKTFLMLTQSYRNPLPNKVYQSRFERTSNYHKLFKSSQYKTLKTTPISEKMHEKCEPFSLAFTDQLIITRFLHISPEHKFITNDNALLLSLPNT